MTELEMLRKSHKVMLKTLMSAEHFLMGKARKDPGEQELVFELSAAISIAEDNMAIAQDDGDKMLLDEARTAISRAKMRTER